MLVLIVPSEQVAPPDLNPDEVMKFMVWAGIAGWEQNGTTSAKKK